MATVSTLGIVASTPGNIVFTDVGSTALSSYYLIPNLVVVIVNSFDSSVITLRATVLEATINYGYDISVSTAEVQLTESPNVSNYSQVSIYCGCDPNGPNFQALRFTGLYIRTEATMWPHVYTLVCKGNLYRAEQYRQWRFTGAPYHMIEGAVPFGQPLQDTLVEPSGSPSFTIPGYFTGTVGVDSTDQAIITDILGTVPGLSVIPANISGTGNVINFSQWDLIWPPYRSAWEMIQLFDQAFLGFRTYEDVGGVIRRWQIFGYPHGISDTTFTEGIDIWESRGTRTIEPLINGSYVEGMTDSALQITNGIIYAYVQQSNPFQPSSQPIIEQFKSTFIETNDEIDNGLGLPGPPRLNANRVAEWRLSERNRELVNLTLTTFRDDLLHIGHTIATNIPHSAIQEPVWIQHVTIKVSNQPALFQQTINGLGGGDPGLPAGSTTTVIVTASSYITDSLIGNTFTITSPSDAPNFMVTRTIISNTTNTITVGTPFPSAPAAGDTFVISYTSPP